MIFYLTFSPFFSFYFLSFPYKYIDLNLHTILSSIFLTNVASWFFFLLFHSIYLSLSLCKCSLYPYYIFFFFPSIPVTSFSFSLSLLTLSLRAYNFFSRLIDSFFVCTTCVHSLKVSLLSLSLFLKSKFHVLSLLSVRILFEWHLFLKSCFPLSLSFYTSVSLFFSEIFLFRLVRERMKERNCRLSFDEYVLIQSTKREKTVSFHIHHPSTFSLIFVPFLSSSFLSSFPYFFLLFSFHICFCSNPWAEEKSYKPFFSFSLFFPPFCIIFFCFFSLYSFFLSSFPCINYFFHWIRKG